MSTIASENANFGTDQWNRVSANNNGFGSTSQIQAYLSAPSVDPGGSLTLYVSTASNGTTYSLYIYRMGWYGGAGGRLMQVVTGQTGVSQGYTDTTTFQMFNCPSAYVDGTTNYVEPRWSASYTLNVPSNWVTGCYLILCIDQTGWTWYVPFVVRSNGAGADYLCVRPIATDHAYNGWGGHALYSNHSYLSATATKVSVERPLVGAFGSGNVLMLEASSIHWMECQGYNLAYCTDIDIENNPSWLLNPKAVISLGHDEYWSKTRYDQTQAALADGVGLAFLGGNPLFWQIRWEAGVGSGVANHTVVGYKTGPNYGDPAYSTDPQYGVSNAIVSARWRDPLLNRPENALVGVMYGQASLGSTTTTDPTGSLNTPWTVDSGAGSSAYIAGTGLVAGQSYGTDLVGYEWDFIQSGGPANIQTLGTSSQTDSGSRASTSNTTIYVASSGARVFATGSMSLTWALDGYRWKYHNPPWVVPGIQKFFSNVMADLLVGRSGTGKTTGAARFSVHA